MTFFDFGQNSISRLYKEEERHRGRKTRGLNAEKVVKGKSGITHINVFLISSNTTTRLQ
jgi:hypothetical protein